MTESTEIKNSSQYPDTDEGWAQRWTVELGAAEKASKKWREAGEKIVKRFLDLREGENSTESRINLFTANTQTLRALLYGKTPQVDVKRRYPDANDPIARCAAEILRRALNTDLVRGGDGFVPALKNALSDRLLAGLGSIRLRYAAEFETKQVPPIHHKDAAGNPVLDEEGQPIEIAPGYEEEVKTREDVETDYVHWQDQLWSPCRVFSEVRWWAFKAQMTREELEERFGEKGKDVPLNSKERKPEDLWAPDPWQRADVWEIWDKEHRKVFWVVKGYNVVLDSKDDPLGLEAFFPFPKPLFANLTTDGLMPRPDFVIAQDLYDEVDSLTNRITTMERALRVAGVYDSTNEAVKRLLSESGNSELIPVDNWAMFAEKGGIKGAVDWLPLEMIVQTMDKLREIRQEVIALLYQVTGMSDIMRGEGSGQATATEQAIKAKFASVRTQSFQDEFAAFASEGQEIRAEIMVKQFEDEEILARANAQFMVDAPLAAEALKLLRSQFSMYRVEIKPEAVSLTDYAALKQERVEIMGALSSFLQVLPNTPPMLQPYLLEMLKWAFTGFKGGVTVEGVLDQAVMALKQQIAQQAAQPPPPDPKMEAEKMKAQVEMGKAKMDAQHAQFAHGAKMTELQADLQAKQAEHQMSMQKLEAEQRREGLRAAMEATKPNPGEI